MRDIITVFKWEISKIFSNWRKTAAVFIIPAAVMMLALNIFPVLVNYLSTGSLGSKPITVVDAPESFIEYLEQTEGTTIYEYEFMDTEDLIELWDDTELLRQKLKEGNIYTVFVQPDDIIYVGYNGNSTVMEDRAYSYIEVVLDEYNDYLQEQGSKIFEVDSFNPVTKLFDYRTDANEGASRIVPAVMVLLIYYCTYSLMTDMFASERMHGFYDKLLMTPVSPRKIVYGKLLATVSLVSIASLVTFIFLFFSSWLNRSNDSSSLIPFGMMLFPDQLILMIITVITASLLCAALCLKIIFSLHLMKDIIANLQLPLIYLLFDLLFQIFHTGVPVAAEYLIPVHSAIASLKAIFLSEVSPTRFGVGVITSLLLSALLIRSVFSKEGYIRDSRK